MSKPTLVREGAVVAKRTQRNGNTTLGNNSVNTNAIQDKAVTLDKLADQANHTLWAADGFNSFVVADKLVPVNAAPGAGQYRSAINNRAPILDLAKDLSVNHGVRRIVTQYLEVARDEFGQNGELCWKAPNDKANLIRFAGEWAQIRDTDGTFLRAPQAQTANYIEVVFWGTGLNLLHRPAGGAVDWRATVDGAAEGANFLPSSANALVTLNYDVMQITPVTSNLTPALHTVRIRKADTVSTFDVYGFEIINASTSLVARPGEGYVGGANTTLDQESLLSLSSGFTNQYGTPGTRGGKVVVYLNKDGQILKDVRWTETAQANLASANHSNEEVILKVSHRDFGRAIPGSNDPDQVINAVSSTRAFNLADNSTNLMFRNTFSTTPGTGPDVIYVTAGSGNDIVIHFIGTGLDVTTANTFVAATLQFDVIVDGTSVGIYSVGASPVSPFVQKLVSGLPFGSHVVRLSNPSGVNVAPGIMDFIVYGPKTPQVPSGSMKLAEYNLMATFAANSTANQYRISTGVIRKNPYREFNYVNGTGGTTDWQFTNSGAPSELNPSFYGIQSDRLNAYAEYTFWGTGFDFRTQIQSNGPDNLQVSLQNLSAGGSLLAATTTNFPTMSTSVYGTGSAFNSSTGVLDMRDASTVSGAGFVLSSLPLALWKVRFNNGTAGHFPRIEALDIITPVYTRSFSVPGTYRTENTVGNNSLGDARLLSPTESANSGTEAAVAQGITVGPTVNTNAMVPLPNMKLAVVSAGGWYLLNFSGSFQCLNASSAGVRVRAQVNGRTITDEFSAVENVANSTIGDLSISVPVYLEPGNHQVTLVWRSSLASQTVAALGTSRILSVVKL